MAQDTPAAARARVVDVTAIDQAIAYLLMFAALLLVLWKMQNFVNFITKIHHAAINSPAWQM
ncbi:hypothetical protein EJB05_15726, partial [Eragrostis curvula]